MVSTNITSATLVATAGITVGTLNATTLISSANIAASLITTGTLNAATLISTSNVSVGTGTIANLLSTTISASNLIINNIDMTPNVGDIYKSGLFTAGNNVSVAAAVTGLSFGNTIVRGFNAWISTALGATAGNKAAWYTLQGIQKDTAGSWVMNSSFVGDNLGITFTINSSGQILYTTTNTPSFVSNVLRYEARTTPI